MGLDGAPPTVDNLSATERYTMAQAQNLNTAKATPKEGKPNLKYMRDKDREMVRGMFRFFEVPGGTMSFPFRKYKEDEVENFTMVDGEIYTVPRGVAHHLSNNCWYPEHSYKQNEQGIPTAMVTKKKRRCTFEPLDFMDVSDLRDLTPSNVETVTLVKQCPPCHREGIFMAQPYQCYAVRDPVYGPAMRLIASITNASAPVVTTTFDHGYITGTIVRFDLPPAVGMQQLNQQTLPITVTGTNTFTMPVDTTTFQAFAIPVSTSPFLDVCAQCVPMAENNDILTAAVKNQLQGYL